MQARGTILVELHPFGRSEGPVPQPTGKVKDLPRFGALDLGTNNCRLLIAEPVGDGFRVVDSFSRIVRLGEGFAANRQLSRKASRRTIAALHICAQKLRDRGVGQMRCVATEVCRRARNGAAFVERVRKATGLALEIISPEEEASLTFTGCGDLLEPAEGHALVFDIGGGSTEVIWVRTKASGDAQIEGSTSLPIGVVTLAEGKDTDVSAKAYDAMVREVKALLHDFETTHGITNHIAEGGVQMLGTSGTTTTLASIAFDLKRYDRARVDGSYLERTQFDEALRRLLATTLAERIANPCIGKGRADLVIQGCAILEAIWRTWPLPRLRVADRGIREGILKNLIRTAPGSELS